MAALLTVTAEMHCQGYADGRINPHGREPDPYACFI
jgi:hypothetical protein